MTDRTVERHETVNEELQGTAIFEERSTRNMILGGTASVTDKYSSPPEDESANAGEENKAQAVNTVSVFKYPLFSV